MYDYDCVEIFILILLGIAATGWEKKRCLFRSAAAPSLVFHSSSHSSFFFWATKINSRVMCISISFSVEEVSFIACNGVA